MDSHTLELIVAIIGSIMASSGFWALVQKRIDRKDNSNKLLLGLAHDRIMYLGGHYLEIGSITSDEYENLVTYLYEPYLECGGNGSVKHIMERVMTLEIRSTTS